MPWTNHDPSVFRVADMSPRIEPTPHQGHIAEAVVYLAEHAQTTGLRIHAGDMTLDDWRELSDAYAEVSDQAERQAQAVESVAATGVERLPRLSEIVSALGVGSAREAHWVIVPGRRNNAEPCDRVPRMALCGVHAVAVQALDDPVSVCDVCQERLRIIHREIGETMTGVRPR
nr:hypothetical protein [Kibdelosporangium sp. MJ126-NF4]CEL21594.1 hypothetical protein [Kibdelosporangium sp. MJ126-NF4]CTQ92375.1 hypothetical protein [Kibdelosporangium sp. MJ126-NF4]